ncbi:hypothetical protein ACE10Z_05430 [Bradyrhizobium sp. Pha-3]|uniref:hypothetical protein n=1 Tax=Bradyrhizobium sp. Pha-3 TaxID=208375 RepID=UPI0035D44F8D
MWSKRLTAVQIGGALILQVGWVLADPSIEAGRTIFGNAPIGHLQPRSPRFSPGSSPDRAVQRRESEFDARQEELNRELDRKLNICRC